MSLRGVGAKPGAAAIQILGFPVRRQAVPLSNLGKDCMSYVDKGAFWMALTSFRVPPSGSWTLSQKIPNDSTLKGIPIATQTWYLLPPSLRVEMSNGVFSTLGN